MNKKVNIISALIPFTNSGNQGKQNNYTSNVVISMASSCAAYRKLTSQE